MCDQMKTIDGADTICLYIFSESFHYKHFKQNREQLQLHVRVNDAQNIMIWRGLHFLGHRKNSIILSFRVLELSFRYLFKAHIMYFWTSIQKQWCIMEYIVHNGIYDIAFPKQSETQNLMMVNKILDIYILLYFRGRSRSLVVLFWLMFAN